MEISRVQQKIEDTIYDENHPNGIISRNSVDRLKNALVVTLSIQVFVQADEVLHSASEAAANATNSLFASPGGGLPSVGGATTGGTNKLVNHI